VAPGVRTKYLKRNIQKLEVTITSIIIGCIYTKSTISRVFYEHKHWWCVCVHACTCCLGGCKRMCLQTHACTCCVCMQTYVDVCICCVCMRMCTCVCVDMHMCNVHACTFCLCACMHIYTGCAYYVCMQAYVYACTYCVCECMRIFTCFICTSKRKFMRTRVSLSTYLFHL